MAFKTIYNILVLNTDGFKVFRLINKIKNIQEKTEKTNRRNKCQKTSSEVVSVGVSTVVDSCLRCVSGGGDTAAALSHGLIALRLCVPVQTMPLIPLNRLAPRLRRSVEGLNLELEEVFVSEKTDDQHEVRHHREAPACRENVSKSRLKHNKQQPVSCFLLITVLWPNI